MKTLNKFKAIGIFFLAFFLFIKENINAQVGIGTANPATSAQLDLSSTTKGFLPPRMTQAERDAIQSPVPGLMIWCKDCGVLGEIQVYNGGIWTNMMGGYPAAPVPPTVTIGTQEWMTKNLDVVTYRNGDTIPEVTDAAVWANLTTGAWCYYDNDPGNGVVYGKLYNGYAMLDSRGLAPIGWHIPDNEEWRIFNNNLGLASATGDKMRASVLWKGLITASNESGFTAIPGGERRIDGVFDSIGTVGKWWSNYYYEHQISLYRDFSRDFQAFGVASVFAEYPLRTTGSYVLGPFGAIWSWGPDPGKLGFSIRCIRD
ncbi:MAG: hypothetical protein JWR61_4638 [Ferruginibacter sp.]|uniref:fibrobacter succinogenes major paralogous domain-containing protein n=1 Tax=Ferruginibacter sp. TaxID=1940288 RepID=UPI002658BB0F|nr:fibrobacter succinogenes major paralogous domain-containing protein [Ferruginibacter sp.]MDB5279683.1 hypothetical protein [Ferruginibacter sp.]